MKQKLKTFAYEAVNSKGFKESGQIEATHREAGLAVVRAKGLFPTKFKEATGNKEDDMKDQLETLKIITGAVAPMAPMVIDLIDDIRKEHGDKLAELVIAYHRTNGRGLVELRKTLIDGGFHHTVADDICKIAAARSRDMDALAKIGKQ